MAKRILIVDDEPTTRLGLAALLDDAGYETVSAATVPDAMQILERNHPDLLLVDIRLDAYNGLQVVAMAPKRVPAIVMTGFDDAALEADARRLGADYLLKPVTPSALLTIVADKFRQFEEQSGRSRRWPRKDVTGTTRLRVDPPQAHVCDVSYGGVRLEVRDATGGRLPVSFRVTLLPDGVSVPVDVRWTARRDTTTWWCGAAIPEEALPVWRGVVDALT